MAQRNRKRRSYRTRYSRSIALLGVFILVLIAVGLWLLNILGVVNLTQLTNNIRALNPLSSARIDATDQLLLDKERIAKRESAVARVENDIARRERNVAFRENQLEAQQQELQDYETQIDEREKTLNSSQQRFENRRAVIEENLGVLRAMRPEEAVQILEGYDDQLLVDTFVVEEELADRDNRLSLVAVWLSRLPSERAAAVQRKSILKYGN